MSNDVGIEIFIDSVGAVKGADKVKDGLKKVKEEADKVTKEVDELKTGLSKLGEDKGVKKTGDEFKGLKKESSKAKKEIGELNKKIDSLNKSDGAKNVRTSIKKVKEEAEETASEVKKLQTGITTLGGAGNSKKGLDVTGAKIKGLKNESLKAKNEVGSLNAKINSLGKADGPTNVTNSIKKVKEEASDADKVIDRLKQGVVALFAFGTAKKALEIADNFNILQQRIKTATKATGDFKSVSEDLFKISQKNGTALQTNVELFQSLARVAPELNATNSQMLKLTETVGQLGVIGGSSTEAMKNGLLQFTQGLAAGTFRAEEFNSILDNIPEVASRIAIGMGVTVGELRKMVIDGKLLSKDVFDSLLKQSEGIAKEVAKMPLTLGRSVESFKNSLQKALGTLDQNINGTNSLAKAIQAAGMALEGLAEHSEAFITVGQVVATLIGARLAGALVMKARATIAATAAMIANAKAASSATVSVSAYTGAITRTAGASTAATVAATGLRGALAFLGGPAGIAVLAAGAIYSFATSGDEASESTDELIKRVNGLNKSLKDLRVSEAEQALTDIASKINVLGQDMIEMRESSFRKFQALFGESIPDALQRSNEEITLLAETYKIKHAELEALKAGDDSGSVGGKVQAVQDEFMSPMPLTDQEQRRADDIAKLEESLKTEEELIQESYERRKDTVQMGLVYNDQSQAWYDKRLTAWYTKQQKDLLKKQKAEQKAAYIHFQRKKLGEITYYKDHAQTLTFFNQWEVKTEQEKARFLMDTSMGLLNEMGQHSKTAFKVSKAFNLADATVQGLGAVQKALNSGPFPWNVGAAALVAAKTAIQIKGIKSQQFSGGGSAPSFSGGGGGSIPSLPSLPDFENALPDFGEGLKTSAVESVAANDPIQTTEQQEPRREITVNINLEETIDKIDPEAQLSGTYVRTLLGRIQEEIENGVNINLLGDVA